MKTSIKAKHIIFVVLIALLFGFLPAQAQEKIYKKTSDYLVKDGMYGLCVEVHFKYREDKSPLQKIIDNIGGVDYILNNSVEKYRFSVYIAEVYDRVWVVSNIIRELEKYYYNKGKNSK